jgi:SAM-dependent methyltransferase
MLQELLRTLVRKKTPVTFPDLSAVRPVSSLFGTDRGTPIDRYYIENFLLRSRALITGRVLEVGDDSYSRRFGGNRVESFEVLHAAQDNTAATIVGDLTDPATLPENAYDCFICTQTFNFIFDVQKAVQGSCRLLKPGGVLLATVAGISQISRYDMDRWGDYWRFTSASVERLFSPVFRGGATVECFGNALAACAFLQGIAVEDLPDTALLDEHDHDYQVIIAITARKAP